MPASERLLEKLHETLGHDATNDLVAWVGEARSVNRVEVRELAELYFSRFDTRLEERIARSEAKLEAKLEQRTADVRLEIAALRTDLAMQGRDQIKYMFAFWIGTIAPLAGLIIALHRL